MGGSIHRPALPRGGGVLWRFVGSSAACCSFFNFILKQGEKFKGYVGLAEKSD